MTPVLLFMTPGESLTPWALLIEEESYLPSRPYLGQITTGKRVASQNENHPNRAMQNYLKIGKYPLTLHKTEVKQMTAVSNAYISYTQTSVKTNFCLENFLLLADLFTPSFNILITPSSHQEADICRGKVFRPFR